MKNTIGIIACLLAFLMLFGCTVSNAPSDNKPIVTGDPKTEEPPVNPEPPKDDPSDPSINIEPEPEPDEPAFEAVSSPKEIDLTVSYNYTLESDDGGRYISATGPVLAAGYESWGDLPEASEFSLERQESIRQLSNNLEYMTSADAETLKYSAQMLADDTGWFSIDRNLVMTRCDEDYISYYTKAWLTDPRLELESVTYYAVNLNKDGLIDTFYTAFTDIDSLAEIVFHAFEFNYPFTEFYTDALSVIENSIETRDGIVSFAFSNGGVIFMVNGNAISDELEGHIAFISYTDHPELVKPECMTQADSWIVPMVYGVDYTPDEKHIISIYWDYDDMEYTGFWTVCVNGVDLTEKFYGYSPDCWLIKKNGEFYLYLRVPVGDVSRLGKVYKLSESGATFVADTELAFASDMNYNTEHLIMLSNDFYYGEDMYLDTVGMYRIGDNGVPELVSSEFKLNGSKVTPRKTERLYTSDGGFTTVAAGIEMTPYMTDKLTYLDYLTEDGRIIRININEFGWDMLLFGDTDPDEFFERVEEGNGY